MNDCYNYAFKGKIRQYAKFVDDLGGNSLNWEIPEAQQRFAELIRSINQEPQLIYDREQLVAAVVDAETFQEFLLWHQQCQKPSLADEFAELRRLCAEEDYSLEVPPRQNRPLSFVDNLDDVSL